MKIIVLQLARLGDILNTLPTLQSLKKTHPDSTITLVTRKTFADAARLSPHVDNLVEMSTQEILGPYLVDEGTRFTEAGRAAALEGLQDWVRRDLTGAGEYDLLINLTFSEAGAYLASIIPAKERRGMCRVARPTGDAWVITDSWSQYFFSQVVTRNLNIIHLNDLFTRIANVGHGAWPLELAEPAATYPVMPVPQGRMRIGIQVGASRSEKNLEPQQWAAVCNAILAAHPGAELAFFGAASELSAIEQVMSALPAERCINLCGKMRFHENIHWVRSCSWIVAPDTAIVHLASVSGVRTIQIPLGEVRPYETGPYGDGHRVIFPANANIDQLAEQIARVIGGEKARPVVAEAVTRLVTCRNGMTRGDLSPHNFSDDEASNFFMRSYYLLAEFRCSGREEDIEIPTLGDPGQKGALDRLMKAHEALCSVQRLADFGSHYCMKMLDALDNPESVGELMAKLAEIETMLGEIQKSVPLVKPLIDTWKVAKDVEFAPGGRSLNSSAEELIGLTEGTFRELSQNIEIVQRLLQTAVEAAQKRLGIKAQPPAEKKLDPKERAE